MAVLLSRCAMVGCLYVSNLAISGATTQFSCLLIAHTPLLAAPMHS